MRKMTGGLLSRHALAVFIVLAAGGCVQRTLHVETNPPGAIVYMNDQEIGRSPVSKDFTWFGKYDVQIRADGYETYKKKQMVLAPWWQWPPFDLVAELMPWHPHYERTLSYTLKPASTQPVDATVMLGRAADLRAELESSAFTRTANAPTTRRVKTTKPISGVHGN